LVGDHGGLVVGVHALLGGCGRRAAVRSPAIAALTSSSETSEASRYGPATSKGMCRPRRSRRVCRSRWRAVCCAGHDVSAAGECLRTAPITTPGDVAGGYLAGAGGVMDGATAASVQFHAYQTMNAVVAISIVLKKA